MASHVDDIVRPSHDSNVAFFVSISRVHGVVVALRGREAERVKCIAFSWSSTKYFTYGELLVIQVLESVLSTEQR